MKFGESTGISIAQLVKVARDRYGVTISPEQIRALRKGALVNQRFVIQNRGTAFYSVDSMGAMWTAILPSALGFGSREAAERYIAKSFHPSEIEASGITVEDVSAFESAPRLALGGV